jgi:hypothetical protein
MSPHLLREIALAFSRAWGSPAWQAATSLSPSSKRSLPRASPRRARAAVIRASPHNAISRLVATAAALLGFLIATIFWRVATPNSDLKVGIMVASHFLAVAIRFSLMARFGRNCAANDDRTQRISGLGARKPVRMGTAPPGGSDSP